MGCREATPLALELENIDYYLNSAAFKVCDTELVTAFSAFGFSYVKFKEYMDYI